jgi:hypothetical protein
MEETRIAYKILVSKCLGYRLLGRPRRRWEDNLLMVLREMRCKEWVWM